MKATLTKKEYREFTMSVDFLQQEWVQKVFILAIYN